MSIALTFDPSNALDAGRKALAEGRWEDAYDIVSAHISASRHISAQTCHPTSTDNQATTGDKPIASAYELLGLTAWYLDNAEAAFEAYDAAYRLSVEAGDRFGQARAALWIVACRTTFRDQNNIATGWLRRVYDSLDRRVLSRELGWMRIRECEIALQAPSAGIKKSYICARKATEIGRRLDDPDLQVIGHSIEGLTLMAGGRLPEGTERLNAATAAIAEGRFTQPFAAAEAYTMIVDAWERVRLYDQMEASCDHAREFCTRWRLRSPLAICQTQYAGALMARGRWAEAEAELASAAGELSTTRPGLLGRAIVRLGELRRRQGRLIEATRLFERAAGQPSTGLSQVSALLDRGNATRAFYVVNRIRRWVLPENRAGRLAVQEVASRASLALPDVVKASEAIDEIQHLARTIPTPAFVASAACSRGIIRHATGDLEGAVAAFTEAKAGFTNQRMSYDAARASMELADSLAAAGRIAEAVAEAEAVEVAATAMGATPLVTRAAAGVKAWHDGVAAARAASAATRPGLPTGPRKGGSMFSARRAVSGIGPVRPTRPAPKQPPTVPAARVAAQALGLSAREYRILKMLAEGRTVPEMAKVLRGGEPTIDRDLANMLRKMGASSRAAAVATAKDRGLV